MCSSIFGPASVPSLLMCPMSYHGHSARLGEAQQCSGALAYLRHTARTCVHVFGGDGLYGVYHHQFGLDVADVGEDAFERCLAEYLACLVGRVGYAFGTHLELVGAFLTAHIEYPPLRQPQYGL